MSKIRQLKHAKRKRANHLEWAWVLDLTEHLGEQLDKSQKKHPSLTNKRRRALTMELRQWVWTKYNQEIAHKRFKTSHVLWNWLRRIRGRPGAHSALIHGCLSHAHHMAWALAEGLADGIDKEGRSVLHAACKPSHKRMSKEALLLYLRSKNKQQTWRPESKEAIQAFIVSFQRMGYDEMGLYKEMVRLLAQRQPNEMSSEYVQRIQADGSFTDTLYTVGVSLWFGAAKSQGSSSHNEWLDWIEVWEKGYGWNPSELKLLTTEFSTLPEPLKAVLSESRGRAEKHMLRQKHASRMTLPLKNTEWAL